MRRQFDKTFDTDQVFAFEKIKFFQDRSVDLSQNFTGVNAVPSNWKLLEVQEWDVGIEESVFDQLRALVIVHKIKNGALGFCHVLEKVGPLWIAIDGPGFALEWFLSPELIVGGEELSSLLLGKGRAEMSEAELFGGKELI